VGHPERCKQSVALRRGQPLNVIEHRRNELMQSGERKLHLGLHPSGTRHTTT